MLNGSFAKIESEVSDIRRKINNHEYEHDLEGNTVKAKIQLDNTRSTVNNLSIIKGRVIDFKMLPSNTIEESNDGEYTIKTDIAPRPVWADFQIIGSTIIRIFTSGERDIALDVLSHGIKGTLNFVKPVNYNLQKMYADFKNHWIGSIYDREGNMEKGVFYGNTLEKDDVIGKCWKKNKKSTIGFITEYFGTQPVKVRVTQEGGVQVHSNISDEQYLQFVLNELSPYMVEPPRSRRRRT